MTLPVKIETAIRRAEALVTADVHDAATFLHPVRTAVGEALAVVGTDVRAALDAEMKALEPTLSADSRAAVEAVIQAGVQALITHGI